jgi:soluble lytic murein transglycosylase-like protein
LRKALLAGAILAVAASARAEIAVLSNGLTLKVTARRTEGGTVFLTLKDGGEVGVPPSLFRGVVPDEVVDEVARAQAQAVEERPADLRTLAADAARRHGLDPELVLAVVSVESAFQPDAVSPKGARGLMQLMPATAASLDVADAFDPEANLEGGTRHLESLVSRYDGDLEKALAAYNAGEGAVSRYGGVPPYRETRAYVRKVLDRYRGEP